MEIVILFLLLVVLCETSFLFFRSLRKIPLSSKKPRRKVFVDTSALIDGRILSIAQSGFLGDEILIPRSVIRELQLLADGNDAEKRLRARFGMDIANELERVLSADVEIFPDELDRTKVDERLIELARTHHGIILTNDFNLTKVAATEHIETLNVNDLAQNLRSEYLPGEKFTLKITAKGNSKHQGIGYLPDATMVVVDDAERYIGKEVEVEFIRFLQTSSGKMMFAKLLSRKTPSNNRLKSRYNAKNR